MPLSIYKKLAVQTLANDKYLCLYLHPWEFANLSAYKMPRYTKKPDGIQLAHRLDKLITSLKAEGNFIRTSEYVKQNS